jgi:hypothetical protein
VGEEAVLNGLSGLAGSAACLYSLAAKERNGTAARLRNGEIKVELVGHVHIRGHG